MSRRVVVTGVGLVCALGIGTEQVWQKLLAGESGVGPITQFDASAFDCRIAAEVHGFDPLIWIAKKDLKKMGRFIQLAVAATDFAMRMAGLEVTPDIADATGVYIASGIGGFDIIEREHCKLARRRSRAASLRFSFPRPSSIWLPASSRFATARAAPIPPRPRLAPLRRTRSATPSASSSAATPKS